MTREIKFRAWDKVDRIIIEWSELRKLHASLSYIEESERLDARILMQYTGLLDKNGKEIYEGDIVKGTSENPGGPSEVFYDYGVWQPFNFLGIYDGTKYEVIGNIYESPELIKK